MSHYLKTLNPEQYKAVTTEEESTLILAGAGSGKTKVLTTRIAWLLENKKISPFEILAVTFTNKAAKEMFWRISNLIPISFRGMWIGTFHAICNKILRHHYGIAKLPLNFQILDSNDQIALIKRIMKENKFDVEKISPKQVQYFINTSKDKGLRFSEIEVIDELSQNLAKIYNIYDNKCMKEGVVDFGELIFKTFEILKNNKFLLDHYNLRFKHILVDEFQDTNTIQYNWLKLITGEKSSIFAVGDDDQSIYKFRGAKAENMLKIEKEFSIKKVIKLEQNYRSQANILDAANALISNNKSRLGKNLWTASKSKTPVNVYHSIYDYEESEYIINEIIKLSKNKVPLKDIAILYRSNAQSRIFEYELVKKGIAYKVYGGMRFFERQEIKNALSYLRIIENKNDDGALLRIINFPTRGIGQKSLNLIQSYASEKNCSLWESALYFSGINQKSIANFVSLIDDLKKEIEDLKLEKKVAYVNERSGLIENYKKDRDSEDRIENLNELVNAASVFDSEFVNKASDIQLFINDEKTNVLSNFLSHAMLESGENQAKEFDQALQLMTIHSSKGLEFNTVFITGIEEGLFPHDNSLNDDYGLEEERRLMYVAMTRAKTNLYLSYSESRMLHGQTRYNIPSRFLSEIPSNLLNYTSNMEKANELVEINYPQKKMEIGANVLHPVFGKGIILQAEGSVGDMRVQVRFENEGLKWLALEYANLKLL